MNVIVKVFSTANPSLISKNVCPPLTDQILKYGFQLHDEASEAQFLICLNHNKKIYSEFRKNGGKPENAALVRLEPAAVFPSQYKSKTEKLYGKIITPGSVDGISETFVPWPYFFNQNPLVPDEQHIELKFVTSTIIKDVKFDIENWKSREILLSLIASNKVSPIRGNNYRIRRRFAHELPPHVLSIYGGLWRANLKQRLIHRMGVLNFAIKSGIFPNFGEVYGNLLRRYPTAVGMVRNKHDVVRQSKFSLVIENDNHYVSEKLIDALLGGSIPIYLGGDFTKVGIPKEAVVSDLANTKDILDFLNASKDLDADAYLSAAKEWLTSPSFHSEWSGNSVFARIGDEIATYFRNSGQ